MLAGQELKLDDTLPTLATDGKRIYVNEPFFMTALNDDTQVSGIAHELLHVVLEHPYRRAQRDPRLWNVACDYKVNQYLEECGFTLGKGWLRNKTYEAMSEEQIYETLKQDASESAPDFDDLKDPQGSSQEQANDQQQTRTRVVNAYTTDKKMQEAGMGEGHGLAQRIAAGILRPPEPWYDKLRRLMTAIRYDDWSYARINRRALITHGLITADLYSEALGEVVLAVDVSGSIGQAELDHFEHHVNSILEDCRPRNTVVAYFDGDIAHVDEYEPDAYPIKLSAHGGGGTDFIPIFDMIAAREQAPDALIVLTDTYGRFPDEVPDYPVIWASTIKEARVPFGDVVEITL